MVELTSRQRELVRKLCRETTFCTVADLARSVDASARTVRSDLRSVESFMAQHGAALERVPGTGIRLSCASETRAALQAQANRAELHTLNTTEQCAVAELLLLLNPLMTFQRIADTCRVSRQTLVANFEAVEQFFAQANVVCQRDRGKGVRLIGDELGVRRCFLGILSDSALQDIAYPMSRRALEAYLLAARAIVNGVEIFQNGALIDREQLELVTAFSLSRIHMGNALESSRVVPENPLRYSADRHGSLANHQATQLSPDLLPLMQLLDAHFPSETESFFLASVILSQRSGAGDPSDREETSYQDEASTISRDLVDALRELHVIEDEPLRHLIDGLTLHVRAAIWRVRNGNQIHSDTPRQIMVSIPLLYDFTRKQMSIAEERHGISFNESEIAYIAMYLDTIYETSARDSTVLNVLFLCSFGLASSSILMMRLSHVLGECRVHGPMTTADAKSFLAENPIDLIISTSEFSWEKTPVLIVDPLLSQGALEKVKNELAQASYSKMCTHFLRSYAKAEHTMDLPHFIHDLIRRDDIQVGVDCSDWREAIRIAAAPLLKRGVVEQHYVERMICAVEDYGPYMVLTPGTAYVHAGIHDGIKENCLAMCVLSSTIPFGPADEKHIRTIIVLGVRDKEQSDLLKLAPILEREENILLLERDDLEIDDVLHLHG